MTSSDAVIDRLDWFREIQREDPISSIAEDLMKFLYEDGEWEELRRVCSKYLDAYPRNVTATAYFGLAEWKMGNLDQARVCLRKLHTITGFLPAVYTALASIEKDSGEETAARYFEGIAMAFGSEEIDPVMKGQTHLFTVDSQPTIEPSIPESETPPPPSPIALMCNKGIALIEQKLSSQAVHARQKNALFDDEARQYVKHFLSTFIPK